MTKRWVIKEREPHKGFLYFTEPVMRVHPTLQLNSVNKNNYLEVDLKITEKCNLNCEYCVERCDPNNIEMQHQMSKKDFDAIVELYKSWNLQFYNRCLLYGGESSIHPDVTYLLERFNEVPTTAPIFFSNGLIPLYKIEEFCEINPLVRFCVTWHDSNMTEEQKSFVKKSLCKMREMQKLQRFYVLMDPYTKPFIECEKTISELYEMLGVTDYESNQENYRKFKLYYKAHTLEHVKMKDRMKFAKYLPKVPIRVDFKDSTSYFPEEVIQKYKMIFPTAMLCEAGLKHLYINTNGDVYSCEEQHYLRGTIYDKITLKPTVCFKKWCDCRFTFLNKQAVTQNTTLSK